MEAKNKIKNGTEGGMKKWYKAVKVEGEIIGTSITTGITIREEKRAIIDIETGVEVMVLYKGAGTYGRTIWGRTPTRGNIQSFGHYTIADAVENGINKIAAHVKEGNTGWPLLQGQTRRA
jgi:hypothetical protein